MGLIFGGQGCSQCSPLLRHLMNCTPSLEYLLRGYSMGRARVTVSKGLEARRKENLRQWKYLKEVLLLGQKSKNWNSGKSTSSWKSLHIVPTLR